MEDSKDYRLLAAEALRMAEVMASAADRAILVGMAQIWHRLAAERGPAEPQTEPLAD